MAHAQKPDLVFQRNGRVHLYRRGCQFSRLLAAEVCASAVVTLDIPCPIQCTTAGYPLHSPFPSSLLHPCVSVCHHIPCLLYNYSYKPGRQKILTRDFRLPLWCGRGNHYFGMWVSSSFQTFRDMSVPSTDCVTVADETAMLCWSVSNELPTHAMQDR